MPGISKGSSNTLYHLPLHTLMKHMSSLKLKSVWNKLLKEVLRLLHRLITWTCEHVVSDWRHPHAHDVHDNLFLAMQQVPVLKEKKNKKNTESITAPQGNQSSPHKHPYPTSDLLTPPPLLKWGQLDANSMLQLPLFSCHDRLHNMISVLCSEQELHTFSTENQDLGNTNNISSASLGPWPYHRAEMRHSRAAGYMV